MKGRLSRICLTLGFLLALYPAVSGLMQSIRQAETVSTFQTETGDLPADQVDRLLEEARAWNAARKYGEPLEKSYDQVLDLTGTGIMATLSIPAISVNLPVYHGTAEDVLSAAAGHVEFSDLPVGEPGNHAVISGHRGLPSARLFTRLDELKQGDRFYLDAGRESMAYEVTDIQVIEPYETEKLEPVAAQDLVSLVTCTPYGINTHRLVVTGRRTSVSPAEAAVPAASLPSARELLILMSPAGFVLAAAYLCKRKEK
ncbi:class C sortase [uncultured Faecalibaculum sp.]|uniref:class C sortase n=2 Tax=uncultured Faecalibaculum sp. TaxID=1729681 RepID=UPI0025F0D8E5|nr:class C sortase [uncultured Faecalibaculum sp.]